MGMLVLRLQVIGFNRGRLIPEKMVRASPYVRRSELDLGEAKLEVVRQLYFFQQERVEYRSSSLSDTQLIKQQTLDYPISLDTIVNVTVSLSHNLKPVVFYLCGPRTTF